jgi:membrane carboxypeptidase/penicillin-binding protein
MPVLSMALGAGETTLLRMVGAYGMIANGGKQIKPTLIDRVRCGLRGRVEAGRSGGGNSYGYDDRRLIVAVS